MGEWPANYEAQVKAAVLGNPVAQRALRLVSEAVGGAPLMAEGGGETDRERALALVRARSAGQGLAETLAAHLLLHGNGYVQIATGADGAVAELFALRPERVSIEADARGWPMAYLYRVGENVARLPSEDAAGRTAIIHVKSLHPLDDHYGLGCAGAAAGAVAIHNAATVWNKALLDNAARPSGALVFDAGEAGGPMSAEQFDRIKAEMAQAEEEGADLVVVRALVEEASEAGAARALSLSALLPPSAMSGAPPTASLTSRSARCATGLPSTAAFTCAS